MERNHRERAPRPDLFHRCPYIEVGSRKDVEAFLGFATSLASKNGSRPKKAEYIAKLIEESKLTYAQVMRKIGSKTPTVRQNYISYRLLLQMEEQDGISVDHVEEKFSVLFLSLRTDGVQQYLDIDIQADPSDARTPVPREKLMQLANFAMWLFGTATKPPIVNDKPAGRSIWPRFSRAKRPWEYLERTTRPSFEVAFSLAGGDEPEGGPARSGGRGQCRNGPEPPRIDTQNPRNFARPQLNWAKIRGNS